MNDYDYDPDNYEVAQASLDDWQEVPFLDEESPHGIDWLDASEARQYGSIAY